LPIKCDIRNAEQLQAAIEQTVLTFGGIDILINNASAISLSDTESTQVKTFDLMNQVNARGTWLASKLCLPHLLKSQNPHILTLSPPLDMNPKWFKDHTAYTLAKSVFSTFASCSFPVHEIEWKICF
jgi:citronellol/citronellal dehydrogenase